ncbi:hypothetical protein JXJ21_04195 [candidate division KSB1 bacterium]|nr:hypothetical protein [candidate division KSB1 bacterium]
MDKLIIVFVLATGVEGLVEFFGQFIAKLYFLPGDTDAERRYKTETYTRWATVVSTLVGILLCFWGEIGILKILNVEHTFPWGTDFVLCGIIIGRGSKSVHDFIRRLDVIKEKSKQESTRQ